MAGSLISMIPIIIIYLFAQKHFKNGLMAGGIKGEPMREILCSGQAQSLEFPYPGGMAALCWSPAGERGELTVSLHYDGAYGMGEKYNAVNQKGHTAVNVVEEKFCFQGEKTYCRCLSSGQIRASGYMRPRMSAPASDLVRKRFARSCLWIAASCCFRGCPERSFGIT